VIDVAVTEEGAGDGGALGEVGGNGPLSSMLHPVTRIAVTSRERMS
jgi:hypothetical protein